MGDWVGKKQSINEVGRGKTARGGGSGLYTHLLCLCGLFLTYSLLFSTLKEVPEAYKIQAQNQTLRPTHMVG